MKAQGELLDFAGKGGLDGEQSVEDGSEEIESREEATTRALMEAARRGDLGAVEHLIGSGADVNGTGGWRRTALMEAAHGGHLDIVKYLIDHGAVVNAAEYCGWTTLMKAARFGHFEVVKYLVDHGAGLNAVSNTGETALFSSAEGGCLDIVKYFIDRGGDVNAVDVSNGTVLTWAAGGGHLDVVEYLVSCGTNVNATTNHGWSALMAAAQRGSADVVNFLIEHSADVNAAEYCRETALMIAARNGHLDVTKTLVDGGADVNATTIDGSTALIKATRHGSLDVVSCLVASGADLDAVDNDEETAMTKAARDGHWDIVKHLADCGADVNVTDNDYDGWTTLILAAWRGHLAIVEFLIERGADVNATGKYEDTPLMRASEKGHLEVVNCLVSCGADVNATDDTGVTALIVAAVQGYLDIVKCFIDCGVDGNATGIHNQTVLMMAAGNGRLDVAKYLVEHGSDVNASDNDGCTALMMAAGNGPLAAAKYVADRGVGMRTNESEESAAGVKRIPEHGRLDVVKYLVGCGANMSASDKFGRTSLNWAAKFGRLDVVKFFDSHGVDANATDADGETAFMVAARNGHFEVANYFIDRGADVNATDNDGWTALTRAVQNGHLEAAKFLVDHGADVNTTDYFGRTNLVLAAASGHLGFTKFLLDRGVDVNGTLNTAPTALVVAAENGHLGVVKHLIDCGAELNATDQFGKTAFALAASRNRLNIVKFLAECGANVNLSDNEGHTALILAASQGFCGVVKFLVEIGADTKVANNDGLIASTIAARNGHPDVHRMLTQLTLKSTVPSVELDFMPTNMTSSSLSEVLISPFELDIKQPTDLGNTVTDFIATWLDTDVALKLFVPDATNTSFSEEVTLWHQLRHPNIIKLYGVCNLRLNAFVCELTRNGSVLDYLKSCEPEDRRPWKYLHHTALGLAYLHERGIVHGDLRGSNILLGDDDQAKLANFVLSGPLSSACGYDKTISSHGFIGPIRWQSPELIEGGKPSFASDVYALGLCIFELLNGKAPWHSSDDRYVRKVKRHWKPELNENFLQPAQTLREYPNLMKSLCCQNPSLRVSAAACARMFEELAKREESKYGQPESMPSQMGQERSRDQESWQDNVSSLWTQIQKIYSGECGAYPYICTIGDLTEIHEIIKKAPHPIQQVEQFGDVLQDIIKFIQNTSHTTLVIQLSPSRATGSSVQDLRQRISALKRELDIAHDQVQNIDDSAVNRTQLFISEISKTWLILNELKANEEGAAFLAFMHSEINRHAANYSDDQRKILQQAYDELRNKLGASEDLSRCLPAWYVPWYELVGSREEQIGSGAFGNVYRTKWLDSDVAIKRLESPHSAESQLLRSSHICTQTSIHNSWVLLASARSLAFSHSASNQESSWAFTSSTNCRVDINTDHEHFCPDERTMFEREVNIWFNLSHPHVVRLFGACHVGRQPFFVCEYAPNGSLDKYLTQHPEEIWTKLYEAALGLLYLHERGIVHCDLKCNNIVVGSDRKAKVTDFGLSLATRVDCDGDETDQSGSNITGAWNWLAPELILGKSTTPTRESDVFSFGMCIVETLRVISTASAASEGCERPLHAPWGNIESKTALKAHLEHGQHLPTRPTGCSDAQWRLVEKICKFDPDDRIQMCVVVDELAVLAGMRQKQLQTTVSSTKDLLAVASSARGYIAQRVEECMRPRDKIYQAHDLLWTRIEDILSRIDADANVERRVESLGRLEVIADEALQKTKSISSHLESLVDFIELEIQVYGLHRRLDKMMTAGRLGLAKGGDTTDASVHDWKWQCCEMLGVDSSVAENVLSVGA